MNYLIFDTTTPICQVGIAKAEQLRTRQSKHLHQHGEQLLQFIDELLEEQSLALKEINLIGITRGPGSFVGTRLGCAVAQSFAFSSDIPVITVSTLQAIAQTAYEQRKIDPITVLQDARMGQCYLADYQLVDAGIMSEIGLRTLLYETSEELIDLKGRLIVGTAANRWHTKHPDTTAIIENSDEIDMQALLRLVQYHVEHGECLAAVAISADYGSNAS